MATLMMIARSGTITDEMEELAKREDVSPEKIRVRLADGRLVIIKRADGAAVGVGEGLSTKINVNVGTSTVVVKPEMEVEKAKVAVKYGADTVMDLSTGGDLDELRRMIMKACSPLPLGTVPTYQAFIEAAKKKGAGIYMTEDDLFRAVERHLKDGVSFATIHAGITKELALKAVRSNRLEPIVSRGGAMLAAWMLENDSENPYYKNFDYLLELFAEYDAVISLGDALRPGAIHDALDDLQVGELLVNARLVERARKAGVQVMVEGPGHVPLHLVAADVKLMKSVTKGAPYYVLGPLVTDIAAGYDHIAAAIGAAIAAAEGADLICYLTPAEHLSLPTPDQVREGLIAAKIAAHAGDIVKLGPKAKRVDDEVGSLRAKLAWGDLIGKLLDPETATRIRNQHGEKPLKGCAMCGDLCVFLLLERARRKNAE